MKGLNFWHAAVFATAIVGFFVALILVGAALGIGAVIAVKTVEWAVTTPTTPSTAPATVTPAPSKSWGEELWYAVPTDLRALWTRPVAHGVRINATATGCDIRIAVGADSATISHATSACERLIAASKPAAPKVATAATPAPTQAPLPEVRWWTLTDPRDGEEILIHAVIGDYRLQVTRGKGLGETKEIWTVAHTPVDQWTTVELCDWCSDDGWVILVGTPEIASSSEYLLGILFPLRMTPVTITTPQQVEQGIGEEEKGGK